MSDFELNFILFCYCVPDSLMFDKDYWTWRLYKNPDAFELMQAHLKEIYKNIKINLVNSSLAEILLHRGCNCHELNAILNPSRFRTDTYDFIASKFVLRDAANESGELYVLNQIDGDTLISSFSCEEGIKQVDMYLLDDVDGFVEIKNVEVDGQYCGNRELRYYGKNICMYSAKLNGMYEHKVKVKWKANKVNDMY